MPDFDSGMEEACESVMSEVLCPNGKESTAWWLARAGISFSDCSKRPQEFDDALVELFQAMGALVIEGRILSRFYRTLGAAYDRGDSLCFADEVGKARMVFDRARGTR
jgi:hypothetical protein